MTRKAIWRRSAEKFISKLFGVNLRTARAVRLGIEKKYGKPASKKLVKAHPRVTKAQLRAAEAAARPPRAKKPPSRARIEYVLHFDYGSRKTRNLIRFQVHLIGPRVPDGEAIEIARQWERTGRVPGGWTQRAIYWGHPRGTEDVGEKPTARTASIEATALNVGRSKVRRKGPVS